VRNSKGSVHNRSDGSATFVKDPPLFIIEWLMILDSHSVLVSSDMFVPEESLAACHSASNLESNSIGKWLLGPWSLNLVDIPGFTHMITSAVPEDYMSMVMIIVWTSMDFKAFSA